MKPVIIGCRTEKFSQDQLAVFREHQPFGMIIFAEPFKLGPMAVQQVIAQFKSVCPQGFVFIDAEGGKVNRLKPEFGHGWRDVPDARSFADLARENLKAAQDEIRLNAQMIGRDLVSLGINVNCAPVVDLVHEDVLGVEGGDGQPHATSASLFRRSFGDDPQIVTECARAFIEGLESVGVCAVVKHVPGYGRVSADPHYAASGIETPIEELQKSDFLPFRNLNDARAMMTGHAIYKQIDPDRVSTLSPKIFELIRKDIGFEGVLISDTIEMNSICPQGFSKTDRDQFGMGLPLPGTLGFIANEALNAGCDLVMHSDCSRNFLHTTELLEAVPELESKRAAWLIETMTIRAAA
jgi:beta-N-acetylhexosaminidase